MMLLCVDKANDIHKLLKIRRMGRSNLLSEWQMNLYARFVIETSALYQFIILMMWAGSPVRRELFCSEIVPWPRRRASRRDRTPAITRCSSGKSCGLTLTHRQEVRCLFAGRTRVLEPYSCNVNSSEWICV